MLKRREAEAKSKIEEHMELVRKCLEKFREAVRAYVAGDEKGCQEAAHEVHHLESEADGARREIQQCLFRGAFPPLLREDFLKLAELTDAVANKAEEACDFLVLQRPLIPEGIRDRVVGIAEESVNAFLVFMDCVRYLEQDLDAALKFVRAVQSKEHEVDELRWEALRKLFDSELEMAQKLLTRDLIVKMSEVSDCIEDASDQVAVMVVKSRV